MINVFFKGYGQWYEEENPDSEATEDIYMWGIPFSRNYQAKGVFRLAAHDEMRYRHTEKLDDVRILLPSTHPDSEYTRDTRRLSGVVLRNDLIEKTVFLIDTDQPMELDLVKSNKKSTAGESKDPWKINAWTIAMQFHQKDKTMSVERLATKTHTEMTNRKNSGEKGMTGRGGKVPSADTIKRHALTGIKK